jgi:hypothetical protein
LHVVRAGRKTASVISTKIRSGKIHPKNDDWENKPVLHYGEDWSIDIL